MRKIPTLFRRDPDDMRRITREAHPDCQWVIDGEGVPTRKYDGTCVMFDAAGQWWARREVKPGLPLPPNFAPIQHDHDTGKTVGWVPIEQSSFARWHAEALENSSLAGDPWSVGLNTYELVGPRINGNPEQVNRHYLWLHAEADVLVDVPRDFDGLAKFLTGFEGEGIVWHWPQPDGSVKMAKLKRRDFPKHRVVEVPGVIAQRFPDIAWEVCGPHRYRGRDLQPDLWVYVVTSPTEDRFWAEKVSGAMRDQAVVDVDALTWRKLEIVMADELARST